MFSRRSAIKSIGLAGFGALRGGMSRAWDRLPDQAVEEVIIRCMGSELIVRWEPNPKVVVSVKQIRDSIEFMMDKWNMVLSDYDDESEAARLTQEKNIGVWQRVSEEFAEAFTASRNWHRISEGAFDITCGAVTALRRKRRKISQDEWQAAIRTIGWDNLDWNESNRTLRIRAKGTRFDFGGIGKGIAIDKAGELLESLQVERYVLNFSGNFRAGAPPTNRDGWPVEIERLPQSPAALGAPDPAAAPSTEPKNPFPSTALYRLRISGLSMATSGDSFQSFPDRKSESQGDKSSHILDPWDGSGLRGRQLATVITKKAADADAAATAICVQLRRNNRNWLDKLALPAEDIYGVTQEVREEQNTVQEFGGFSAKVKLDQL